jgi:hypothetical protein
MNKFFVFLMVLFVLSLGFVWAQDKCGADCQKACCAEKKACGADCQKACCAEKKACGADCQKACCAEKKACGADCQKACCGGCKEGVPCSACTSAKEASASTCPNAACAKGCTEECKAMQQAWMASMTPGVHHEHLKAMVGSWKTAGKFWCDPKGPATESSGTASKDSMLGGRYLVESFKGEFMGMIFEGMGAIGFNNVSQKYQSVWMDNMGTAIFTSVGTCDETGKVFTFKGMMDDPMSKAQMETKTVLTVHDENKHSLMMYLVLPDGSEFKNFELVYTRN